MILCLADDITGLTEIACMAVSQGLSCWTCFDYGLGADEPCPADGDADVLAVNLACRTFPAEAAFACVDAAIHRFRRHHPEGRVYLKIDSAARGPVDAMLRALAGFDPGAALPVMLTNPATHRAVRAGQLLVDGMPIHETAFRDDPIHPAQTSDLRSRIGLPDIPTNQGPQPIDGESESDVETQAAFWAESKLAAGAAPFGVALFRHWVSPEHHAASRAVISQPRRLLAVIGSRHPNASRLQDAFGASGLGVFEVREASSIVQLPAMIHARDLLGAPDTIVAMLAAAAHSVLKRIPCDALYLTGGETAQSVLKALGVAGAVPLGRIGAMAVLQADHPVSAGEKLELFLQPGSYISQEILDLLKIDTPT